MKKRIYSIILILAMMFVSVSCSRSAEVESDDDEPKKETKFETLALEAILECDHVLNNMEEYDLDEVTGKITDKDRDGDEAEVECKLTYTSEYAEMKETLKCDLEKTDDGWEVEKVEVLKEIECTSSESKGEVYYLNFKPELDDAWKELAEKYTELTGVEVTVLTTATGTYEVVLQSEMEKDKAPTLFQVNGQEGLENWKDYCYDLFGTDIHKELHSDDFALKDRDKVLGVAYVIETYGIIVNTKLLDEAGYVVDDIKSFDDLKEISEDIASRSDELGFTAFTSAGMDLSSDWRFKTHLANLPIYYEFKKNNIGFASEIKGTYLDNYRDVIDLYINNSTCESNELEDMSGYDSENEFVNREAVFYQNGSWEYSSLISQGMKDDELSMIPIYFGVGNEKEQGLCTGSENYWCVNKNADEADIKATLDFINWCVTSEEGTSAMAHDMGLEIPYAKAVESSNLFMRINEEYITSGKYSVTWNFAAMPSESWKNGVGYALIDYMNEQSNYNWSKVVEAFVDDWETEYDITH